jgi:hypothetical protein
MRSNAKLQERGKLLDLFSDTKLLKLKGSL